MKTLAYYPGCSLHGTAKELDQSFQATAAPLGFELKEIPGWECCGNTAAHASDRLLAAALPANELIKVRTDMELDTVAVPCAACFGRFMAAAHEMADESMKADVERVVGRSYQEGVSIHNLVDVYHGDVGLEKLAAAVTKPFAGLKVAAYYGCLLTRPPKVTQADNPEYPVHMDEVLKVLGATPVDWSYKTDCCGASLALCEQDMVISLTHKILKNAVACGAEAVICACPLCQVNLDTRQAGIKAKDATWNEIPIIYLSQMVARAIGLPQSVLGLRKHMVDPVVVLA